MCAPRTVQQTAAFRQGASATSHIFLIYTATPDTRHDRYHCGVRTRARERRRRHVPWKLHGSRLRAVPPPHSPHARSTCAPGGTTHLVYTLHTHSCFNPAEIFAHTAAPRVRARAARSAVIIFQK